MGPAEDHLAGAPLTVKQGRSRLSDILIPFRSFPAQTGLSWLTDKSVRAM